MANLSDFIPGLADAERQEREWNDYAFLPFAVPIAGLDCVHLTIGRAHILMQAGSPFVCGGEITASNTAQFLWVVSPEWSAHDAVARDAFYARIGRLDAATVLKGIRGYVDAEMASLDSDDASTPAALPPWSWVVGLVDLVASEYGWTLHEILWQVPLCAVFQLARRIAARHGDVAPDGPLTGKLKREYLERLNSRN